MRRRPVRTRSWRIAQAGAAGLFISLVGFASPASAHVSVIPSTTAAGAHAILRFSVEHGCKDSPTTRITIQIPPQITSVTPTRTALWKVTKRVDSVVYNTDTPLPDGYREVFELAVQLPEAAGTTLAFPTIQTCEQGESAWIEVPQDGRNVDELALPAPAFVISAPTFHHDSPAAKTPVAAAAAKADNLTLAALVAGLVGAALGGAALFRQHRPA